MAASGTGVIVVGVDGSPTSIAALRWAAVEASRRAGRLLAVRAVGGGEPTAQLAAEHAVLSASVRAALGVEPEVPVVERIIAAPPHQALLSAARGADLIVVGSRGHSGLLGRILGSTAISVARTASVPVVVVPAADTPDEQDDSDPTEQAGADSTGPGAGSLADPAPPHPFAPVPPRRRPGQAVR
ncbi:universal stress protein [Actinocatenispora sera]|uniref:Universal stress protein n=1 Tax=Actinocatenispora sera TaxID=390989 RepID=A0A810L7L2_9ACTN|nr:universal stress protein [Actinocatenispora sera]BCJ31149.1 universal stress protein [Actinocatenispora sera]